MTRITRLNLDVLKPHHPDLLELGRQLASQGKLRVKLVVKEMDERTETLQIEVTGPDIDFDRLKIAISEFGASLHSIDEVEVEHTPETPD
ncbi:MAG: DUF211 domain-containing protein [Xanthomonadales bacterium]|nr:DUF211 domain-containing protein [Xanthomonadales bacterium]